LVGRIDALVGLVDAATSIERVGRDIVQPLLNAVATGIELVLLGLDGRRFGNHEFLATSPDACQAEWR